MAKTLTLTIVIPAYNEESYLKSCLEAIAQQTVRPDEVIVVDNNSTDKTADIARSFAFVRLIHEKRQGLYYSRQTGMNAAKSNIIARIDADTMVEPRWVAAIKDAFKNPATQAASGPVGYHDTPFPNLSLNVTDSFLRTARRGNYHFLMGANMVLSRSAWMLIRGELCNRPDIFEDIDIAIHLSQYGIEPRYLLGMEAMVSCRRVADKPKDFIRYMGGHSRTFAHHGIKKPAAYFAKSSYVLFYFGFKLPHMMYDPAQQRFSLSYFLQKSEARPDPMAVD